MIGEKIKNDVENKDAIKIIEKYNKKLKHKSYDIFQIKEKLFLHYIIQNRIEIKRAFGLKPRIIEHIYWVDATDGTMLRTKDIPDELENISEENIVDSRLSKEKCIELSKDNAFKHASRFYKSFWTPTIEAKIIKEIYLPYWEIIMDCDDSTYKKTFFINGFSGQITEKKIV